MHVGRRLVALLGLTLLLTGQGCDRQARSNTAVPAAASQSKSATTDALPTGNGPYDILARTYAPYTSSDDPVGFPMKVRNLAKDNYYRFWRGSKELFYEWCKTNVADWMADQEAYLRIHGDLHPGN